MSGRQARSAGTGAEEQAGDDTMTGQVAEDRIIPGELYPIGAPHIGSGEVEPMDTKTREAEAERPAEHTEEQALYEE